MVILMPHLRLVFTDETDPNAPDTSELEALLREIRNENLTKAKRQDAVNSAAVELAFLLIDEQSTGEYLALLAMIIDPGYDGSAVMDEFRAACEYVWPRKSNRDLGVVYRAKLKKRWGVKEEAKPKKAERKKPAELMF